MTHPNGVTTNYSYDDLSRLLSVLHQLSASTIDGAVYTVDAAGNRTSKADQVAGVTSNYSYDAIYELTQVTQGAHTTESYTYDPVGNRLSSLGLSPYQYNASNEMVSTPNALYVYDNNGNLTSETTSTGTTSYAWDFENRLTQVTLPNSGGSVTLKYEPFGQRIEEIAPNATSIFVYEGDDLIEETNGSGAVVARYAQGENVDEPLAMSRSSVTSYYEADGLGSITSLTNGAGSLAQTYTFDSFGIQTGSSGTMTNPFQYTARESDAETNLYYFRARQYDSGSGRFTSEDRIGFYGGNDFYAYVHNHVTDSTDPFGLCGLCDNVPPHPADASLDANITAAQTNGYMWWYNTVKTKKGPWDYKWYQGKAHPEYDNFGNFNFGATGCALRIPLDILLRGAGYGKSKDLKNDPYGNPLFLPPYGNQPDKQGQIIKGFQWCRHCEMGTPMNQRLQNNDDDE
jgi:RHS repeat-associated protein